jgi:hypothetical protein
MDSDTARLLLWLSGNYQTDLEARKQIYQECVARRVALKKPGWDDIWKNNSEEEKKHRGEIKLWSISEARNYQSPGELNEPIFSRLSRAEIVPLDDDNDMFQAVARMELARRNPLRQDDLFFHKDRRPYDPDEYWGKFKREEDKQFTKPTQTFTKFYEVEPFHHIAYLWDTADFGANYFLRTLYLYGATPDHLKQDALRWRQFVTDKNLTGQEAEEVRKKRLGIDKNFSPKFAKDLKDKLLGFKFWLDEPFFAEPELNKAAPAVDDALSAVLPADVHLSAAGVSNESLMKTRKDIQLKIKTNKHEDISDEDRSDDSYKYEMTYWSENHQILFATAEYLAGQMWPKEIFRAGRDYRDEGPEAIRKGDLTGAQHMEKAKPRLLKWLNDRLRFGFSEWNSSVYYQEDFNALFNLADFCVDEEIQTRACMVLDLMIFDLARFINQGSFGVTAGRNYKDQKMSGWEQSIGDMFEILFGCRRGVYVGTGGGVDGSFATLRRYEVPQVLIDIGQDRPERFIDRSRVSVTFEEGGDYGVGFKSDDDLMFWWGKGAFFTKQIVEATREAVEKFKLLQTDPFKKVLPGLKALGWGLSAAKIMGYASLGPLAPAAIPLLGNPFSQDEEVANALSVMTEGSALTRANLYTYRNRDAMLSSVQNFHPGQINFQSHACQATLTPDASVWTTHPSAGIGLSETLLDVILAALGAEAGSGIGGLIGGALGGFQGAIAGSLLGAAAGAVGGTQIVQDDVHLLPPSNDGPDWWTGSVTFPRVLQMNNAAIIAYKPKAFQALLAGHRTHAWFPKLAFDQQADVLNPGSSDPPRLSSIPSLTPTPANCNVDTGAWIFGKAGNGYVALFSGQEPKWTTDGDWKDREIMCEGERNIFILQIGNIDEYGSYEEFKHKISRARIHINGLHWKLSDFQCSYDIPRTKRDIKKKGPGSDRLELHYDEDEDQVRINGQPFDDSRFPRFENSYIKGGRALWGDYKYTIKHNLHSLTHDFTELKDAKKTSPRVKRRLNTQEHGPKLIERLNCKPQSNLGDRGTSDKPSLVVTQSANFTSVGQNLFMAWKGVEDDSNIYWSSLNGTAWSPQSKVEGIGSSHAPALISYGGSGFASGLLMAWKGVEDDSGIYYSQNPTLLPNNWLPQKKIEGVGTSCKPALVACKGFIYMVWKGVEDDSGIYYSRLVGDQWEAQQKIYGVGTSDSPALGVMGEKLYLVWKGIEDDSNVYYAKFDKEKDHWEEQRTLACPNAAGNKFINIGTSHGPAVTFLDDALMVAWKGVEDDSSIWFSIFEDEKWSSQVNIKGLGTSSGPALAAAGEKIYLAWKGIEDDSGIYITEFGLNEEEGSGFFFLWPD